MRERKPLTDVQVLSDKLKEAPQYEYKVFPTKVEDAQGNVVHESEDALWYAISELGKRCMVTDGDYKIKKITKSPGGTFFAENSRKVRIIGGDYFGATVYVEQGINCGPMIFKGFYIEASEMSAFGCYAKQGPTRVSFYDCEFNGMYDHGTGEGRKSKWGLMLHGVIPASPDGVFMDGCHVYNVCKEHNMYAHTFMGHGPEGEGVVIIKNSKFENAGRTNIQHVGRVEEPIGSKTGVKTYPGYSPATLKVINCEFANPGLADGGSGVTVQGIDTFWLIGCKSRIGFDEELKAGWLARKKASWKEEAEKKIAQYKTEIAELQKNKPDGWEEDVKKKEGLIKWYETKEFNKPFGSGHLVSWSEKNCRNGVVDKFIVVDYDARSTPDAGDRQAANIRDIRNIAFLGSLVLDPGAHHVALEIQNDPICPDELDQIVVDLNHLELYGEVRLRDETLYKPE